jgi:tRNA(fMet)-specific endonuclease VapC
MGIILDTAILIKAERSGADLASLLKKEKNGLFGISVVSIAELLHGAHRADTAERRAGRFAFADNLCQNIPVFDYDMATAKIFAEIWSNTACRGISIGFNDLVIAATAISRGYSLMTINRKDFENIEGLHLENSPSLE